MIDNNKLDYLKVFLCYSSCDKKKVRELYERLRKDNVQAWIDEVELLPGQIRATEITRAIGKSDAIIVCLSKNSVEQRGDIHKEIKQSTDIAYERPEGSIFIIPVKLEECNIPESLKSLEHVNYFEDTGYSRLLRSLDKCYAANTNKDMDIVALQTADVIPEMAHRQEVHVQRDYSGRLRDNPIIVDGSVYREQHIPIPSKLRRIKIQKTRHGSIEFTSSFNRQYVIKRTRASLVDEIALKQLENILISASMAGMSVNMATPMRIWREGDYICEIQPFYDGIDLKEIVKRNKYRIQGTFLGLLYNCGFLVLDKLHKRGLIHRDATPQNLLMTPDGDVIMLDFSFCCRIDSAQRPVFDLDFSPPEQKGGQSVPLSDWFTFAASLYFLANAEPPPLENSEHLVNGIWNIDTGGLFKREMKHLENIYDMLHSQIDLRPKTYDDLRLETGTCGMKYNLLGVLDIAPYGFLMLYPHGIEICNKVESIKLLRNYLDKYISENMKKDIYSFIAGDNPWLL